MATFEYFDDEHPRCENAERVRLRTFIPSRGSCGGGGIAGFWHGDISHRFIGLAGVRGK